MIINKDAISGLKDIEDGSVDCICCSPPYYNLRSYRSTPVDWGDWKGELGQEPNPDMFVDHLVEVFNSTKRVLKQTGTLFVVISDTYASGGGAGAEQSYRRKAGIDTTCQPDTSAKGKLRAKFGRSLLMIPEKFAIKMIEDGWLLRQKIIQFKNNSMPSSVKTRFSNCWEYIYFFVQAGEPQFWVNEKLLEVTKSKPKGVQGVEGIDWDWKAVDVDPKDHDSYIKRPDIKFDVNTFYRKRSNWTVNYYYFKTQYEPYSEATLKEFTKEYTGQATKDFEGNDVQNASKLKGRIVSKQLPRYGGVKKAGGDNSTYSGDIAKLSLFGRIKRDVWQINTQPLVGYEHYAAFSEKIPEVCINAGCPELICSKCGLPQVEVLKEVRIDTRPGNNVGNSKSGTQEDPNKGFHNSELSTKRQAIVRYEGVEKKFAKCRCGVGFIQGMVFDPFGGSGTTGLVAKKMGRDFILIEINPSYIEIIKKRLGKYLDQNSLLDY